jgi:hypothetical protein
MNNFSEKKRRTVGLLFEALVLIFVFSGSWSQVEFSRKNEKQAVLKASPVEQIAFRDSDSYMKSLLEVTSKIEISDDHFTPFTIDLFASEIANTSCLYVTHSLYNSFYIHLTGKAP